MKLLSQPRGRVWSPSLHDLRGELGHWLDEFHRTNPNNRDISIGKESKEVPNPKTHRSHSQSPIMEGNAVTNSCQICRQHRDRSTLVADMIVNMINRFSSYYIGRKYCFHKGK
jgi:hypothetical protein